MRTALSVVVLLGLAGCTSQADAPPEASAPPAATPSAAPELTIPGEPLPDDCRGELRPVTTALTAACIARRAIPPEAVLPSGKQWYHTVTFRKSRWLVLVYVPGARGGGYLIHVDPKTGRVLKVEPQR